MKERCESYMEVSKQEIIHMAQLACLNLNQEEIEKYTRRYERYFKFCKYH